jgi:L-fuconolactonase
MTGAIADAHIHLFQEGYPGRYGKGPYGLGHEVEIYERFRSQHSIESSLIIGFEGRGIEPDNNANIRRLAATRPWMITAAYIEPSARPDADAIEALMAQGHKGVSIYLRDAKDTAAVISWPKASWQKLNEREAIISLNATPEATDGLGNLIENYRRCVFLFSHLGLPGRYSAAANQRQASARLAPLLRLTPFPNALVKISGFYAVSDPPHAYPHEAAFQFLDIVLNRFGTERCCWGSDFSPSLDFVSFVQTISIPALDRLPAIDRERVMGGNLLNLIGR